MSLFNLSGIVSLIRDQYPSVQASSTLPFSPGAVTANQELASLTIPRSGVWQLQFDGYQGGSIVVPNMAIQVNGATVFVPSMVFGGITNNQFVQVQVNKGDVVSVNIVNADPASIYACDVVAIQVA